MNNETVASGVAQVPSQFNPSIAPRRSADIDLEEQIEMLHRSGEWQSGVARKVLLAYPDFQITLRTLKAGARISEHDNPGRISVQTLLGFIRMRADGKVFELPAGKMLVLDRAIAHDVEAISDSAFLLTVADPEPR